MDGKSEREVLTLRKELLESQIQTLIFKFMSSSPDVQRLQLEHAEVTRTLQAAAPHEIGGPALNGNPKRGR